MPRFLGRNALYEVTRDLTLAAQGKIKADTVIKGGLVVNVFTKEILPADVAIYKGRIVLVGNADHTIGPNTNIIDASGFYLTPGLLDGHMHVESSMVTVTQFARAALPCGTTTIFMDPHEIANVLGLRGVKLMVDEGKNLPLKVFATMPSCVPSAPGFEDAGAVITPREIAEAMKWDEIIGLGEMMNFPGVLAGDENVHEMLKITMQSGKIVTGHYSIPETEIGLQAYAASGVASCHEGTRKEDALARMRLGMYNKMREGSAWQDIKATIKSLTETFVDDRRALLVTDDTHPHTILTLGHMNHVVKRAIEEGMNPISAIQMATINTAECFRVSHEIGAIDNKRPRQQHGPLLPCSKLPRWVLNLLPGNFFLLGSQFLQGYPLQFLNNDLLKPPPHFPGHAVRGPFAKLLLVNAGHRCQRTFHDIDYFVQGDLGGIPAQNIPAAIAPKGENKARGAQRSHQLLQVLFRNPLLPGNIL